MFVWKHFQICDSLVTLFSGCGSAIGLFWVKMQQKRIRIRT
jgi:hypothetical protein